MKINSTLWSALAAVFLVAACENLSGLAPRDVPRVEIELDVDVEPGFLDPLTDADAALEESVRAVVRSEADLGLRFYPTPSESYGPNDTRPPYRMSVDIDSLNVRFKRTTVEEEGQVPWVRTSVDKISCSVRAAVERRRDDGPALEVGRGSATVESGASRSRDDLDIVREYALAFQGERVTVRESDLLEAVEKATKKALAQLRTPIDREFAPLAVDKTEDAATEE